jgi:murein L,D-transpeptidase YafK
MSRFNKLCIFLVICLSGVILFSFKSYERIASISPIDKIVVLKSKRTLMIYSQNQLVKTYKIALGGKPIGKKEIEGDKKTPEGNYTIWKKGPHPKYHKYLFISYPNSSDVKNAREKHKKPGGLIYIHGLNKRYAKIGRLHLLKDWTLGCIAVTNEEIDELYKLITIGTKIEIKP